MSPHPARILFFIVVVLAWLLTAKAASAEELVEATDPMLLTDEVEIAYEPWSSFDFLTHEALPGRRNAYLTLSAFSEWSRNPYLRETGALVVVGIPLDRLARPVRPIASLAEEPDEDEEADAGAEAEPLASALTLPTMSPPAARACVLAALRAHGLEHDENVDSLATRARASAALPDVRLRAVRATDASLRLSPTQYDPYRYTEAEEAGYRLEATLGFRLNRLLFADEEVALERVRLQRMEARQKLVTRTLRALFTWQTAAALQRDPTVPMEKATAAALRALEAETELEVLTAGACRPNSIEP